MKFDLERIKAGVSFINEQICLTDHPLTGDLRMGFRVGDPIKMESGRQLALIEIGFSGFQIIETNEEVVRMFNNIGVGPYILGGAGFLRIHETLYSLDEGEKLSKVYLPPPEEEQKFWMEFVLQSVSHIHDIREPLLYNLQNCVATPFADKSIGVGICFSLSKPCSEEAWKERLSLHKLEVEAAELYLQSVGGSMEGFESPRMTAIEPNDLADNRVLN
jgi:hypothetical protein